MSQMRWYELVARTYNGGAIAATTECGLVGYAFYVPPDRFRKAKVRSHDNRRLIGI